MQNSLIFESNDIESIKKIYNSTSNKDRIIQKIIKYSDLETIKNIIDEKIIKKNINMIFSIICKRNNHMLSNFFYKKYEESIHNNFDNVFKIICISKNKPLIMDFYNKYKNILSKQDITSAYYSLIKRNNESLKKVNEESYLDIAKWMYNQFEEVRNIEIYCLEIIDWACKHNNILLLKWLFPIYQDKLKKKKYRC